MAVHDDGDTQLSLGDSSLYSLEVENRTSDLLYVGDVSKALSGAPDKSAFLRKGERYTTGRHSRQVAFVSSDNRRAGGSAFFVLRFDSDPKASTMKDLFSKAKSCVSVVYGSSLPYDSGPVQAAEEAFTDGPTTVVMDAGDGYEMKAYVEDTKRKTPDRGAVIALSVMAFLCLLLLLATWNLHREIRLEHVALVKTEPPEVQRLLGM